MESLFSRDHDPFHKKKQKNKNKKHTNKRKEIDTSGRNWKTNQHYLQRLLSLRICNELLWRTSTHAHHLTETLVFGFWFRTEHWALGNRWPQTPRLWGRVCRKIYNVTGRALNTRLTLLLEGHLKEIGQAINLENPNLVPRSLTRDLITRLWKPSIMVTEDNRLRRRTRVEIESQRQALTFKQNRGFELPVVEHDFGHKKTRDIGKFSPFEIKYFDSA